MEAPVWSYKAIKTRLKTKWKLSAISKGKIEKRKSGASNVNVKTSRGSRFESERLTVFLRKFKKLSVFPQSPVGSTVCSFSGSAIHRMLLKLHVLLLGNQANDLFGKGKRKNFFCPMFFFYPFNVSTLFSPENIFICFSRWWWNVEFWDFFLFDSRWKASTSSFLFRSSCPLLSTASLIYYFKVRNFVPFVPFPIVSRIRFYSVLRFVIFLSDFYSFFKGI